MTAIQQYPFIFSNERKYRFRRHLVFWAAWWLFCGFIYSVSPYVASAGYLKNLLRALTEALAFLPNHIFLAYSFLYFIIPKFLLKEKYFKAAIAVLASFAVTAMISVLISSTVVHFIREGFSKENPGFYFSHPSYTLAFMAGLRGGITIGGLAAAIKLMKHWYVEGQKNLQLQKENIESQLQVLKGQVHPHFLFNTLNNIYSFTQNTSQPASKMVMALSDILRYMLYECRHPLVPLTKELKMIEEYIELEKIRYGNQLELHLNFPDQTQEFQIAPLLLLPFVENCFKHGISNVLEHPWLNLDVSVDDTIVTIRLINSNHPNNRRRNRPGIGIENAKRRLELLYPGRHELVINDEEDLFIVNLKVQLEKKDNVSPSEITGHSKPEVLEYAN